MWSEGIDGEPLLGPCLAQELEVSGVCLGRGVAHEDQIYHSFQREHLPDGAHVAVVARDTLDRPQARPRFWKSMERIGGLDRLQVMLRKLRVAALIGFACLVGAQLVPVELDNPTVASSPPLPSTVGRVLRASCYDCHSNQTVWPWYSHLAPISWLVARDVHRARKILNFSDWDRLGPVRQAEMLVDAQGEIEEDAMPPSRYLRLHQEAKLTPETKAALMLWMQGIVQAREHAK